MFFDNIIIFLNVLEQFAIRASIFDFDIESIAKYVNKLYFNNNDAFIETLVKNSSELVINPKNLINNSIKDMDNIIEANYNKSIIKYETIEVVYPLQGINLRLIY
jgi:hypothetical protein